MIPLRDNNPRRTFPLINTLLIFLNVLMFLWEWSLGPAIVPTLEGLAFVPARFWGGEMIGPSLFSIFISMFLHGGWMHLLGNMLYLWIFGDNVEDRLGHFKYLLFYLACGVVATLAHAVTNPHSIMPAVGASGAIAGVLGAYILLFPHARVMTLIPIFVIVTIRELPAVLVLGLWFVLQLFTGAATLGAASAETGGGVAYFAHIGGFIAGMVLIKLLDARPPRTPMIGTWR